jgi:hypothetical protein
MDAAHADDQRAPLIGLDDTQQIHEVGPPTQSGTPRAERSVSDRMVLWALLAALVLAAGALGVGVIALVSSPDAVAGPQGPAGVQGAAGPQGIQGVPGAQGATGPQGVAGPRGATGLTGVQGPAGAAGATGPRGPSGATGASGNVVASTVVPGAPVLTATDPPVGTAATATAACPQGEIVLGGGAQVSAPGASVKSVVLRSSFPTTTNGWRATGSVIAPLGAADQMTVRPYVLCGRSSNGSSG